MKEVCIQNFTQIGHSVMDKNVYFIYKWQSTLVLKKHIIKNQKNEGVISIPFTCKVLKPVRFLRPVLAEHIYDPTCDL